MAVKALVFDFVGVLAFPGEQEFFNTELLKFLEKMRGKYQLIIFTSSSPRPFDEFAEELASFDLIQSTVFLGISKRDPGAYLKLATKLGISPEKMFFIDDDPHNVQSAQTAGCVATVFTTNKQLEKDLAKAGITLPTAR